MFTVSLRVRGAGSGKIRPVFFAPEEIKVAERKFGSIFLSPDKTFVERVEKRKLVDELRKKRSENRNKTFITRKNTVVCLSTDN